KIRREEEKKAEKRRKQFIDYRTRWGQSKQWAAPVTITLIAVSMALSIGTNSIALGSRAVGPTGERQQRGVFGPPRYNLIEPLLFTSVGNERWVNWMSQHP